LQRPSLAAAGAGAHRAGQGLHSRYPHYHLQAMGLSDVWNRTLVYFGIAEDDDWDEDALATQEEVEREYRSRSTRQNVRRLPQSKEPDEWSETDSSADAPPRSQSGRRSRLRGVDSGQVRVHLVLPRSFNDAQQIADRFKDSTPVILNLQSADNELSKRLIDFASGLTYALEGSMQRVADKVFLLTPRNVELSAEDRARAIDSGGFFNQT
jgi:cell division inhibitor SepF